MLKMEGVTESLLAVLACKPTLTLIQTVSTLPE